MARLVTSDACSPSDVLGPAGGSWTKRPLSGPGARGSGETEAAVLGVAIAGENARLSCCPTTSVTNSVTPPWLNGSSGHLPTRDAGVAGCVRRHDSSPPRVVRSRHDIAGI